MALSIHLTDELETKLNREAKNRQLSPEQVATDILTNALENDLIPTVTEVVARIKATPPNPAMITPSQGSLADALRSGPTDPNFDLETWRRNWAMAENELKRINLLDDIEEGRA